MDFNIYRIQYAVDPKQKSYWTQILLAAIQEAFALS